MILFAMKNTHSFKVISLAVLFSLAFVGSVTAQGDYVERSDSLSEIKVWGDSNIQVDDPQRVLNVDVVKHEDEMEFIANSSEIDSSSAPTLAVDTQSDGVADFQIQYKSGSWQIAVEEDGSWSEFSSMPSRYDADVQDGEFSVKVPLNVLDDGGSDYKFGIQVNTEEGQFLYPDGDALWYNGENYVSSEHYQSEEIDHFERDTTIEDDTLSAGRVVDMVEEYFQSSSNFIKDWVRDNFASDDRVDGLEDRITQLEQENMNQEAQLEKIYSNSSLDRPERVDSTIALMRQNNISEIDVESRDGTSWSCKWMEKPGTDREMPVCIS